MITFVLGFLAELAKEFGDWLDRILPAPGLRRPLRSWRRRRPFWAGIWAMAGGAEMIALPLAPLPLMLKVGIGAMSAIGVGLVLIAGGLFFLFAPAQRMFVSVVTAIASLVSLATTNLGGFGIGCGLGLLGSSMAFGWLPHPPRTPDAPPQGVAAHPKAPEGHGVRRPPGTSALALTLPPLLIAGLVTTAPSAAARPGGGDPRGAAARVSLPCLSGVDTGGADNPDPTGPPPSEGGRPGRPGRPTGTAEPGKIGDPDDLTALTPPLVFGDQPGPGRATYSVSPYYPTVNATRLTATDAIIHGATYLPTVGGGRIKVLWVHAARIVADDYHLDVKGPSGATHTLDVQLDIRDVDVYATYLKGSIEIPGLKVNTPHICIGADIIPANLPVAVRLPHLTVEPVTAGQVLVDTADVRYTRLGTHPQR
ncbi:DUF6114 domain-containing protein [Streptomyces natalensis]|uniref:DUF6114 domain-containing protein n=1 Tax=Streptomyces natalensis TaxID=68242 RepID=UPI00068D7B8B|nr:DUF6114 domain-containing protein [Streptomyces natalensis]